MQVSFQEPEIKKKIKQNKDQNNVQRYNDKLS